MPKLVHLVIDLRYSNQLLTTFVKVFNGVLPQIRTLALAYPRDDDVFVVLKPSSMTNLEHLSLQGYESAILMRLLQHSVGLRIKTLHIDRRAILVDNRVIWKLQGLYKVKEGEELVKIDKVVIYGGIEGMNEATGGWFLLDKFEWAAKRRDGMDSSRPPFFEFEGSCE